ncbi:MAG TPA: lycopene cyclase domain-containing protein [Mycobacteriales bacterium]|nr:lycopene cyclase domain-containing protein [Mycobacteriales bacterium]
MSYTTAAVLAVLASIVLDLVALRTKLLRDKDFWTAYGIVLVFQLVTNGVLTGTGTVTYDDAAVLGPRLVFAPVEDLLFGFALVLQTLAWWDRAGQRRGGTSSAARRTGETQTRRSSTR